MLKYDEEKHEYTLDGKKIPSVTQIVSMAHSYGEVNQSILETAARRGTDVHELTELLDYDVDITESELYDAETEPYLIAYQKFLRDFSPEYLLIEVPIVDEAIKYAGRLDRLAVIDGHQYLIDIKTTASATRAVKVTWAMQLAAYRMAIIDKYPTKDGIDVQLCKDGTYKLHYQSETESKYGFNAYILFSYLREIFEKVKGY